MKDERTLADRLEACPFCGGEAKTFMWNGTMQGQCAGDFKECAGTDVIAPVAMWNRRAAQALRSRPSVEEVARVIDHWPFLNWQNLFDYAVKAGDSEEEAIALAERAHGKSRDDVLAKARQINSMYEEKG